MARELIVVDTETTGLSTTSRVVEVAAINVDTGEEMYFVPNLDGVDFTIRDFPALKLNGYIERELWRSQLSPNQTLEHYHKLGLFLEGNTFGGSNPKFDTRVLERHVQTTWHHRLGDLATYAAGKLGYDITDLPGLDQVAKDLGIDIANRHGALDDARATAQAFKAPRNL